MEAQKEPIDNKWTTDELIQGEVGKYNNAEEKETKSKDVKQLLKVQSKVPISTYESFYLFLASL